MIQHFAQIEGKMVFENFLPIGLKHLNHKTALVWNSKKEPTRFCNAEKIVGNAIIELCITLTDNLSIGRDENRLLVTSCFYVENTHRRVIKIYPRNCLCLWVYIIFIVINL